MRHRTSPEKARIEAEVRARRDAAMRAVIEKRSPWDCQECEKEEYPGITTIRLCSVHADYHDMPEWEHFTYPVPSDGRDD